MVGDGRIGQEAGRATHAPHGAEVSPSSSPKASIPCADRLDALAEEWFECCGDIHVPLREAAAEIRRLTTELAFANIDLQVRDLMHDAAGKPGLTIGEWVAARMREAASATETRRAETENTGSVEDEGAVPAQQGDAQ